MESLPRSPVFLAVVLLLVIAEAVWRRWVARRGYDFGAAAASIGVAAGNILLKPVSAAVTTLVMVGLEPYAVWRLPADDWRTWVAGFVAVEFVYYWFHRWSHTIRWLWASHAVHHSANEFTLPAAVRLGWTNLLSGGWLLFAPLVLVGFPPLMIAALLAANLSYQFLLHTELVGRLGPLEWVLNTPSHHRVHHASNGRYLDRNFGGVVIVWDRLFGTFADEVAEEPVRYGLTKPVASRNPFVIALHEWGNMGRDILKARSWKDRARAAFGRP
jgi:sterol desaturase/sphingolipid hydroxylase (fatty acid hydroxylase superfamily)